MGWLVRENLYQTDLANYGVISGDVNFVGSNMIDVNSDPTEATPASGYVRVTFSQGAHCILTVGAQTGLTEKVYDVRNDLNWAEAKTGGMFVPEILPDGGYVVADLAWKEALPADTEVVTT